MGESLSPHTMYTRAFLFHTQRDENQKINAYIIPLYFSLYKATSLDMQGRKQSHLGLSELGQSH